MKSEKNSTNLRVKILLYTLKGEISCVLLEISACNELLDGLQAQPPIVIANEIQVINKLSGLDTAANVNAFLDLHLDFLKLRLGISTQRINTFCEILNDKILENI